MKVFANHLILNNTDKVYWIIMHTYERFLIEIKRGDTIIIQLQIDNHTFGCYPREVLDSIHNNTNLSLFPIPSKQN